MFAGRHIPEKQVPALVRALPEARRRVPGLRARIFGDGPDRERVLELVEELGLDGIVEAPGFVPAEVVDAALRDALCLVLPSRREGYGLVVVEASARGVPAVVVAGPDNAATELVEDGVNGFVAASAEPDDLAEAIARVDEGGEELRRSTAAWFRRNAERLSLDHSLAVVLAEYEADAVTPRVTVLIGAYNNAATLPQAIGSILGQTVDELELLVLDDGSSDETAAVVAAIEDERLRYVPLEHMGIARSLNLGIEQARAPVVAVQDADDWSEPQRLERQLAVLDSSPEVAVVGGLMREVDEHGRELVPRTGHGVGDVNDLLMRYNPLPNSCAAYRREVVLELGGYDARYRYAAEYDLWLRVAEQHRVVVLDEVLATRRMSGTNVAGARGARADRGDDRPPPARRSGGGAASAGAHWLALPVISFLTPTPLKRARRRRLGQAP